MTDTKTVPCEPTDDMVEAAHGATPMTFLLDVDPHNIWAAMLAAAPAHQPNRQGAGEPVAVTIFCPVCGVPHVDEGEWATTRHHKTHQCQGCGHEWRPLPFATVGVAHPNAAPPPPADTAMREALDLEPLFRSLSDFGKQFTAMQRELLGVETPDSADGAILAAAGFFATLSAEAMSLKRKADRALATLSRRDAAEGPELQEGAK